jgi:hypothetical protein
MYATHVPLTHVPFKQGMNPSALVQAAPTLTGMAGLHVLVAGSHASPESGLQKLRSGLHAVPAARSAVHLPFVAKFVPVESAQKSVVSQGCMGSHAVPTVPGVTHVSTLHTMPAAQSCAEAHRPGGALGAHAPHCDEVPAPTAQELDAHWKSSLHAIPFRYVPGENVQWILSRSVSHEAALIALTHAWMLDPTSGARPGSPRRFV